MGRLGAREAAATRERCAHVLAVVERLFRGADDLVRLVALSGDDEDVPLGGVPDRALDGARAIGLDDDLSRALRDAGPDGAAWSRW